MPDDFLGALPAPLNYIIRILLAALCGFAIGFERKTRAKEAGMRTHTIVAMSACLMMIVSKYAFWDMNNGFDASRVAAQIVSGVGFLGTGMIVYAKGTLHGLTTAAGIWATAGVGMAFGGGGTVMIIVGAVATALIIGIHIFLHLPIKAFAAKTQHQIQVKFKVEEGAVDKIKEIFGVKKIRRLRMETTENGKTGTALLRPDVVPEDTVWQSIMDENGFITAMEYYEEEW